MLRETEEQLLTKNVIVTVSARILAQQQHREGYYSRVAVYKALITKGNAHL